MKIVNFALLGLNISKYHIYVKSLFSFSVIHREAWSLVWEWGSFATVISGAPSTSFAHSSASAFPGLGALLGTLPVVGFRDRAVLVVWSGSSVFLPVVLPEFSSVIVGFSVGWDDDVSETDSWWGGGDVNKGVVVVLGSDGGDQGKDGSEFHVNYK